jgi:ubiquinone/menaquinone biosynthesis C-methylase UbiE/uncharacterized protein YbaR (Trm112 family)
MHGKPDWLIESFIGCPYHPDSKLVSPKRIDGPKTGLVCSLCDRKFSLVSGVLVLMPDEFRLEASDEVTKLKQIEQKVRDNSVSTYMDWFSDYTNKIEFVQIQETLLLKKDDVLVDIGCGIGRYTLPLSNQVEGVIAIDFSLNSLIHLLSQAKAQGIENVLAVQADVTRIPIRSKKVGKILASQVFTFLPGDQSRNQAIGETQRILSQGGRFVLTVFNNSLFRRLNSWLRRKDGVYEKEGRHPKSGFYYFNFCKSDFLIFLRSKPFSQVSCKGICNIPRRLSFGLGDGVVAKLVFVLDRLVTKTALSTWFGDLLVGVLLNPPETKRIQKNEF